MITMSRLQMMIMIVFSTILDEYYVSSSPQSFLAVYNDMAQKKRMPSSNCLCR
jgi:hypothetical protein